MGGFIIIIIIIIIGYFIFIKIKKSRMKSALKKIKDFQIDDKIIAFDNKSILAVDHNRKKLAFVNSKINVFVIESTDIIGFDYNVENEQKYKGSLVAALAGQKVAGAKGFFGAYIASLQSYEKIKKLDFIVLTSNSEIDSLIVNLINSPVKQDGIIMNSLTEKMKKWEDVINKFVNEN